MKKILVLGAMISTLYLTAQEPSGNNTFDNEFRIELQAGIGFGFEGVELFVDENDEPSSISGGGGFNINLGGRYVIQRKFDLGFSLGYHSSFLKPQLSNVDASFDRLSFLPSVKYLIGLDKDKEGTINLGVGYGFYFSPKLTIDGAALGLQGELEYKSTSGINLITEYEYHGEKRFRYKFGLVFYGTNYQPTTLTGVNEVDDFSGTGIDLYFGISYAL